MSPLTAVQSVPSNESKVGSRVLRDYFQAIFHKTTIVIETLSPGLTKTRGAAFCDLDCMDKLHFLHLPGDKAQTSRFHSYFWHIHMFCRFVCRRHFRISLHVATGSPRHSLYTGISYPVVYHHAYLSATLPTNDIFDCLSEYSPKKSSVLEFFKIFVLLGRFLVFLYA